MKRLTPQILWEVEKAIEKMHEMMPIYQTILKNTGDKKQALDAMKFIKRIEDQMEEEKEIKHAN